MSTRTASTTQLDSRTLQLVLPALTGVPEEVLVAHLQNQEPVHRAIREVLGSKNLDQVDWSALRQVLYGGKVTPVIKLPRSRLAQSEPIRKQFPHGWYFVCPEDIDLRDLNQSCSQFSAKFLDAWFLDSYGDWPEMNVQRIPTEAVEIFIPDPSDWLLPESKGKDRDTILGMGEKFAATLPEGWVWEEPSAETLTLSAFAYHHQTAQYPLKGYNYARCANRCDSGDWLRGGYFGPSGFVLSYWGATGDDDIGGLRRAVRRGRVNQKAS